MALDPPTTASATSAPTRSSASRSRRRGARQHPSRRGRASRSRRRGSRQRPSRRSRGSRSRRRGSRQRPTRARSLFGRSAMEHARPMASPILMMAAGRRTPLLTFAAIRLVAGSHVSHASVLRPTCRRSVSITNGGVRRSVVGDRCLYRRTTDESMAIAWLHCLRSIHAFGCLPRLPWWLWRVAGPSRPGFCQSRVRRDPLVGAATGD